MSSSRNFAPDMGFSDGGIEMDGLSDQHLVSPEQRNDDGDGVKRTSNRWIAAAFNITAIIGVGVLGIPHSMVFLTWGPGVVVLLLAFAMTFFTMTQLVKLHEFEFDVRHKSVRISTYHTLGKRAFGAKGLWIILALQMVVEVSLDILFTVAAGEAMNRIHNLRECGQQHIFIWFAAFAAIQIFLSLVVPTFESIKFLVILAAIMSIFYTTTAWIAIVVVSGDPEGAQYRLPKQLLVDHVSSQSDLALGHMDLVFRSFNAIGVVAFAYAAHNVVLEIQNGIPSTPHKMSEVEMLPGVWITYVVVAICYLPMGIAVYKIHGNQISQNVLSFIQYHVAGVPKGVVIAANMMLIVHLFGSYQIFAMPIFKQLEIFFRPVFKNSFSTLKRNSSLIIRPLYIVFTTLLAMIFPHFSPLIGFFGGFAIAPTTHFLPCIIWLQIKKPKKWSKDWCFNWVSIILGVLLMIVACVGGLYVLIKESIFFDNYKLWTSNWKQSKLYQTEDSICTTAPTPSRPT